MTEIEVDRGVCFGRSHMKPQTKDTVVLFPDEGSVPIGEAWGMQNQCEPKWRETRPMREGNFLSTKKKIDYDSSSSSLFLFPSEQTFEIKQTLYMIIHYSTNKVKQQLKYIR